MVMTLVEAKKHVNSELIEGVVEDIISINPIYSLLPFQGYDGHSVLANREQTLGTVDVYDMYAEITARDTSVVDQLNFSSIKIIGDADIDSLLKAQSQSAGYDLTAGEISSKAKSVGRRFQNGMVNDDGSAPNMNSLHSLVDATQVIGHETGAALSFDYLDQLLDLVTSKDGVVDFIMMAPRTFRSYKTLLRALGGTAAEWVIELPDGRTTIGYEDIPIFKNAWMPVTETAQGAALSGGTLTSVWAGNFDDGTLKTGVSAIHPSNVPAGVMVQDLGTSKTHDSETFRVKQYTNMALFNRRALARLGSISN